MRIISIPNEQLISAQKVFNPTILEWRNTTLMYYRYEPIGEAYNTDLAVVELDRDFMPIAHTNKPLRLTRWSTRVTTLDDPRGFIWKDRPWIIYPQGCLMHTQLGSLWSCCMAISRFATADQPDSQWLPKYGKNINAASSQMSLIATEKNWTPFLHNERLLLIYTINPLVILEFNPLLDQTHEIHRAAEIQTGWQWGDFLGGGTPLIRRGDEYVGFFHSFTNDFPHQPNCRTYHVGFYAISAKEPFTITKISRKPIMSAKHDNSHDLRKLANPWRPNCVYPCGILERDGKVYMSYGWQDCRCKIAEFTWEEIEKDLVVPGTVIPAVKSIGKNKPPTGKLFWRCDDCGEELKHDLREIAAHSCP